MSELVSLDDQLNYAFRLAYFLLGDRSVALRVAETAVARVEVALAAQGRRLYYRLTGGPRERKAKAERFRNRVSYDELQVLQRQVYVESEAYERQMERAPEASGLDERDLLVFFVKHLVRITIKRNSFYVTLGVTRLLRNYTTSEAMDFYTAVIQDPDRLKDDYYFRSRKGVLMKELKERFGDLVRVQKGPHGEERWQSEPHSDETRSLVDECFERFTPWRSLCPVGEDVAPRATEIDALRSGNGATEDAVEVRRIHAALHAECFRHLSSSLGFGDPRDRLEVPHFALSTRGGRPRGRRTPDPLTGDELAEVREYLETQADSRKRAPIAVLRVLVDGVERARLDPSTSPSVAFEVDEDAERLEVLSRVDGEDLVLASHFFARDAEGALSDSRLGIRLEAGQMIRFVISRDVSRSTTVAEVEYRETGLVRRAALVARKLAAALQAPRRLVDLPGVAASATAVLFIAIVVAGGLYISSPTEEIANQDPPTNADRPGEPPAPRNAPVGTAQTPLPPPPAPLTHAKTAPPQLAGADSNTVRRKPIPGTESDREITRGQTPEQGLALRKVRSVIVEVHGAQDARIGEALDARLRTSGRFAVASERDRADALLDVTVVANTTSAPDIVTLKVRLLNADGRVLWAGKRFRGSPTVVAARVVGELGAAAAAADRIPSTPQRTSP